jgi:adenine-specific DNA-methyltransferase
VASKTDELPKRELLILTRRIADSLRDDAPTATKRLGLCKQLLAGNTDHEQLSLLLDQISRLRIDERHYWIGTFYALLLPLSERRAQAVYFTPPHLAQAVVSLVCKQGFDLLRHTAVDPAAGGAAFLSTLAAEMRSRKARTNSIVNRLHGFEIDSGLARLSEALIGNRIGSVIENGSIVKVRNSLSLRTPDKFDLVLANPPYGRITGAECPEKRWLEVCHPGHINKYALFTELCFRLAKPGGLIGLVLPSSFIAGPLYDRLRTFLRTHGEILAVGSVADREDVFVDVAQDVSVIVARAGNPHKATTTVAFGHFTGVQPFQAYSAAKLPAGVGERWTIPASSTGLSVGGATLADYGATVRSGYFVWNREQERLATRSQSKRVVPLVWAENIRAGKFCRPKARTRGGIDFVKFTDDSPVIVRTDAIVMQRTTNSRQPRRLISARISPSTLKKWGGFVSENHTLTITAKNVDTLNTICLLLNSGAVDARYRQLSGTASISVALLREMDLPKPKDLKQALLKYKDREKAIEAAYAAAPAAKLAAGA